MDEHSATDKYWNAAVDASIYSATFNRIYRFGRTAKKMGEGEHSDILSYSPRRIAYGFYPRVFCELMMSDKIRNVRF